MNKCHLFSKLLRDLDLIWTVNPASICTVCTRECQRVLVSDSNYCMQLLFAHTNIDNPVLASISPPSLANNRICTSSMM